MFETAELGHTVSKQDYEAAVPELRTALLRLQVDLRDLARFPVIVLIGGVDGAGKGATVNLLHEWLDPRYIHAHAFGPPSDEERERPPFWRFWRVLPPSGTIGVVFGSWYTAPIIDHVYGTSHDGALEEATVRINAFEKALADDGALIIKLWFHLSKKVQKKRLKRLEDDPKQRWRVAKTDWKHFELYDAFRAASEHVLRATSTGEAPWTIVEGADSRYRNLTVGNHLRCELERKLERVAQQIEDERRTEARTEAALAKATETQALRARKLKTTPIAVPGSVREPAIPGRNGQPLTILSTLDLTMSLDKAEYNDRLEDLQGLFNMLSRKASKRGTSLVVCAEGWDAAGKGGVIRRITAALDARHYRVIPIAAPTDEERGHHYLWRFWRHLSRAGRTTIFDRSWYGRVLVERVEGFATDDEWKRAYKEINDFETQLCDHGIVLVKFWLHISKDEQLRRFEERDATPWKQFKITAEDWRNRERWDDYEIAVNEMVERTSTGHAPWTLLEANDKRHARIKALETLCDAMKRGLKR